MGADYVWVTRPINLRDGIHSEGVRLVCVHKRTGIHPGANLGFLERLAPYECLLLKQHTVAYDVFATFCILRIVLKGEWGMGVGRTGREAS